MGGGRWDGVTFVKVAIEKEDEERKVRVAVYAGMPVRELQQVLHAALRLGPETQCTGFLVENKSGKMEDNAARKKRGRQSTVARIVPMAIACQWPETVEGEAKVLTTVEDVGAMMKDERGEGLSDVKMLDPATKTRMERWVAALREDERSLSRFDATVLLDVCMQHAPRVLAYMDDGSRSVAEKKRFLLSLVRKNKSSGGGTGVGGSSTRRSAGDRSSDDSSAINHELDSLRRSSDGNAQVDLICKKVVAIAHTVFSPNVQSALMSEAALYRERHHKLAIANRRQANRSRTMPDVNVSAMMELLGIVERLLNKHALEEEQSVQVVRMILAENRVLWSAWQQYRADSNVRELEKTMQRMASLGTETDSAPQPQSTPSEKRALHHVLKNLHDEGKLTTLEVEVLQALVEQDDAQVLGVMQGQEDTNDWDTVRDQLVQIVEEITTEIGDEEKRALNFKPGNGAASPMEHWKERLIQLVQHWLEQRALTSEHVHVLRMLIHEDHNLLQSAYEVYATDGDANELLDTLQRISKLQLQADEGAALLAFTEIVDNRCDALRSHEKTLVKQLFVRQNELVRAAWEVFELERNQDDFADTLLRIARFTTRQDAKLRLIEVVGEMLRRQLLRSHEADGLIRLYEERNEALIAANEAFEADEDVKELVETLLLIVKHANFGDAPPCNAMKESNEVHSFPNSPPSAPLPMTPPSSPVTLATDAECFFATRLFEILTTKQRLAPWQHVLLNELVVEHDDRVMAALDVYADDHDSRELVDTLWHICDLTAWERNKQKLLDDFVLPLEEQGHVPRGVLQKLMVDLDDRLIAAFVVFLGDGDREEFLDTLEHLVAIATKGKTPNCDFSDGPTPVPDEVNDAHDDDSTPSRTRAMEKQLLHFVSEMPLTEAQANALKRAIAKEEALIEASVEVYAMEGDEDDLKDTLHRIAVHIVAANEKKASEDDAPKSPRAPAPESSDEVSKEA